MEIDDGDGGPAFPQHILNPNTASYAVASNVGMSLRDYFASHLDQPGQMQIAQLLGWKVRGINADYADHEASDFNVLWCTLTLEESLAVYARVRYLMADAMLAAREAK